MIESDPTIRKVREIMAMVFEKKGEHKYAARLRRMEMEPLDSKEHAAILGGAAVVTGLILNGSLPINWSELPIEQKHIFHKPFSEEAHG